MWLQISLKDGYKPAKKLGGSKVVAKPVASAGTGKVL